jgi:hypothetical protein
MRHVAALICDAERSQPKAGCRNAGHSARIEFSVTDSHGSVENLTIHGTCLLHKIAAASPLHVVEERLIRSVEIASG